ncbi:MAG: hypothetical protein R2788_18910 [Saprospiraceae bacterium]
MSIPDYFLTLMTGATLVLADENTKKMVSNCGLFGAFPSDAHAATPTTWQILMLSGWQGDPKLIAVAGGGGISQRIGG